MGRERGEMCVGRVNSWRESRRRTEIVSGEAVKRARERETLEGKGQTLTRVAR